MWNDQKTAAPASKTGAQTEKTGSRALTLALDILSSLSRADLAVVPIMPTADMVKAGADVGQTSHKQTAAIYHTMVHGTH